MNSENLGLNFGSAANDWPHNHFSILGFFLVVWVFVAAQGLSLVGAGGCYSLVSMCRFLNAVVSLFVGNGLRESVGSAAVTCMLSCLTAWESSGCERAQFVSESFWLYGLYVACRARSSVYGILLARILEWVAISYFRQSSQRGIKPSSPALQVKFLLLSHWRIFPDQGSNLCTLHWEADS